MSERPDEGTLLAFLDEELSDSQRAEVERWIQKDPSVAQELEELTASAGRLQSAVALLDAEQAPISTDLPLALRQRLGGPRGSAGEGTGGGVRRDVRSMAWGRAAALILAAGLAGATALPGSPVPGWLRAGWSTLKGGEVAAPAAAMRSTEEASRAGLVVTPDLGRLTVRIEDAQAGTTLRVTFGESAEAAVYATGDPSFSTGAGFVDVRTPGDLVQVEVPSTVTDLVVLVGDVVYVSRRAGTIQTPVEPSQRSADELVYRIQTPAPN